MIGNLLTAIALSTTIGATIPNQTNNTISTAENIVYQYETNEVNTIDDLIEGHIYKLHLTPQYNMQLNGTTTKILATKTIINGNKEYNLQYKHQDPNTTNYLRNFSDGVYINQMPIEDNANYNLNFSYSDQNGYEITTYIILGTYTTIQFNANCILESDYLGEPTIVETTTDGLYNTVENFIETYLYNSEKLQSTEYTIMGVTYTMSEWLAHTTTIVIMSVILFVLILFVKWLFKQVGSTFNLVGSY